MADLQKRVAQFCPFVDLFCICWALGSGTPPLGRRTQGLGAPAPWGVAGAKPPWKEVSQDCCQSQTWLCSPSGNHGDSSVAKDTELGLPSWGADPWSVRTFALRGTHIQPENLEGHSGPAKDAQLPPARKSVASGQCEHASRLLALVW